VKRDNEHKVTFHASRFTFSHISAQKPRKRASYQRICDNTSLLDSQAKQIIADRTEYENKIFHTLGGII